MIQRTPTRTARPLILGLTMLIGMLPAMTRAGEPIAGSLPDFGNSVIHQVQVSSDVRNILPANLTRTEIRLLQDALIWTTSYFALKDGSWGPNSAEAARAFRRGNGLPPSDAFSRRELMLLLEIAERARREVGWTTWRDPNAQAWVGYPGRLASPTQRDASRGLIGTDYFGPGFTLMTFRVVGTIVQQRELMRTLAANSEIQTVTYRLDREHRQVLSYRMRERSVYIRFDRVGDEWRGFHVSHDDTNPAFGPLITAVSAEFAPSGSPEPVDLRDAPTLGPILAAIMGPQPQQPPPASPPPRPAAPPPLASQPSPQPVAPAPPTRQVAGSGTAFAVGRDGLLLTNQHVIEGCRGLALASGEPVRIVAQDRRRDLALVRVERRFEIVVRFRRDQNIDLGEAVYAIGFPLYGLSSTAMNLTNGIVTAAVGIGDDPSRFQINANIQPGNSGGPIVDGAGHLIGVAVSRLNDRAVMEATGSMPQSVNFAIRGQIAESFLLENRVIAEKPAPGSATRDLREVAQEMSRVVFPILCYGAR